MLQEDCKWYRLLRRRRARSECRSGAFVDREQRKELVRLARLRDCSLSRIVRRAIAAELERSEDPRPAGVPPSASAVADRGELLG
jgi:predicted transcriptional regulator